MSQTGKQRECCGFPSSGGEAVESFARDAKRDQDQVFEIFEFQVEKGLL